MTVMTVGKCHRCHIVSSMVCVRCLEIPLWIATRQGFSEFRGARLLRGQLSHSDWTGQHNSGQNTAVEKKRDTTTITTTPPTVVIHRFRVAIGPQTPISRLRLLRYLRRLLTRKAVDSPVHVGELSSSQTLPLITTAVCSEHFRCRCRTCSSYFLRLEPTTFEDNCGGHRSYLHRNVLDFDSSFSTWLPLVW